MAMVRKYTAIDPIASTKVRFACFEDYLTADVSDLPEERCEYWDGDLIPVTTESSGNDAIANYLYLIFVQMGVY